MPDETKQTPQEYWQGFPEAPASDTCKWVDKLGFEHMTTLRAWGGQDLMARITKFGSLILDAEGKVLSSISPAPANQIPAKDENGTPIIDGNSGQPAMTILPNGTHLFAVKALFHGKTKTGKDTLGVVTVEPPYNRKWGVTCFDAANVEGWKSWPVGDKDPYHFAPKPEYAHVIIQDPSGDEKYPKVIELRA